MRRFIRRIVQVINNFIIKTVCVTNGDIAELHPGPCKRCVGRALSDVPSDVYYSPTVTSTE